MGQSRRYSDDCMKVPAKRHAIILGRALGVALALVAAVPDAARAYPIQPVPLWDLAQGADLIVVARVTTSHTFDRATSRKSVDPVTGKEVWELQSGKIDWTAELEVLETWKGESTPTLRVPYEGMLLCPAPPRYHEGRTVIAFLERVRKIEDGIPTETWETMALSYGTLYVADEERPAVRERVREALELKAAWSGNVPDAAYREWLLRASDHRATRWHGLLDFACGRLHATDEEKARIAHHFALEPGAGSLGITLRVLSGFESRVFDEAVVGLMDRFVETEPVSNAAIAMDDVLTRFGDMDPARRLGEEPWELDATAVRRIWNDAKRELSMPTGTAVAMDAVALD